MKDRVVHAMQCLNAYVTCVLRPAKIERERVQREEKRRKHALWLKWSNVWTKYKQWQQSEMLRLRVESRAGLVCEQTRNVGRLTPKNGVTYSETKTV